MKKDKITFRLYQIDKNLEDIGEHLTLETNEDIIPQIYRLVWESKEDTDLDVLYKKYISDDRPNKYTCRSIDLSDVVEIEQNKASIFYLCTNFGWTELPEFTKTLVPPEMGFRKSWLVNADIDIKRAINIEMKAKSVIEILVQRLGKSNKMVTKMFTSSKICEQLNDVKTGGLYGESPYYIAYLFENELKEQEKELKGE